MEIEEEEEEPVTSQQISNKDEDNLHVLDDLNALSDQLSSLNNANKENEEDVVSRIQSLEASLKLKSVTIKDLESKCIEYEAENERLRQLQLHNDNTEKLEQMVKENAAQNTEIDKLLARIEELESERNEKQLDAARQMKEMEMLQNSLQSAKCQITDLKKQLKEGRNDSQRTEDSNCSNITQLEQQISLNGEDEEDNDHDTTNVSNLGFSFGNQQTQNDSSVSCQQNQQNVSMNVEASQNSNISESSSEWWMCPDCGMENDPKHSVCMACTDTQV